MQDPLKDNVRRLLEAGERVQRVQAASESVERLPQDALLQADAAREAAEIAGKPQTLLDRLGITPAGWDRGGVPKSLLDALEKSAQPQLGSAGAASLMSKA